jgi:type VI protein secretion system component Hcp
LKKSAFFLSLMMLFGTLALHAQDQQITLDGITCPGGSMSVLSWSFGGTGTMSSGKDTGTMQATLSQLNIARQFDGCSPTLFGSMLTGKIYATVVLTQYKKNADGTLPKVPEITITLTKATVAGYQLGGSSSGSPTESEAFNFQTITITNPENGTTFCWNTATLAKC